MSSVKNKKLFGSIAKNKNFYVSRKIFELVCSVHSKCSSEYLTTKEKHHCDSILDAVRMGDASYLIIENHVNKLTFFNTNSNDNFSNLKWIYLWKRSTD